MRPAWPALEAHPVDHLLEELRALLPRLRAEGRMEQRQGHAHQAAVPNLADRKIHGGEGDVKQMYRYIYIYI